MFVKHYPYMQDIYHIYDDEQIRQLKQPFLNSIDSFVNQRQYVKLTLLGWDEHPIKEIQGTLTGGTLTKDGASSVRRTCSLSATVSGGEYDVQDMNMDFAINKKIYLEIGIKNDTREYKEYPILWFPQGMFFITGFSMVSNVNGGVNISLQLKDKMCMLNGEIGGLFPATTILDMEDTQDMGGIYVEKKVRIYDIIQELVHHFGGEPMENIVIEGVDKIIRRIMEWNGENPLYLYKADKDTDNTGVYIEANGEEYRPEKAVSTNFKADAWYATLQEVEREGWSGPLVYNAGTDVGYIYEDFYYVDDWTVNAGESICNALDKIKEYLGNYEYYYDIYGVFHFQEIKNYMNNTLDKILVNDMAKNDYLIDTTLSKDLYSFDSDRNLVSFTANPQYANIKNDYIVQGLRQMTNSDISYPVRYHLVIDSKPKGNVYVDEGGTDTMYVMSKADGTKKYLFAKQDENGNSWLPAPHDGEHYLKPSGEQVETAKERLIAELDATVASLKNEKGEKLRQIATYENEIADINNAISQKNSDIVIIQGNISSIRKYIIDMTDSNVNSIKKIQDRDNRYDRINNIVAWIPYIETATDEIAELLNKISDIEHAIEDCQSEIAAIEELIESAREDITEYDNAIAEQISAKNEIDANDNTVYEQQVTNLGDIMTKQVVRPRFDGAYPKRDNVLIYNEPYSNLQKAKMPVGISELPEKGNFNLIYFVGDINDADENSTFYYWDDEYKEVDVVRFFKEYWPHDWRTELYMQGIEAYNTATDKGYYWEELESGWPSIYDMYSQMFWDEHDGILYSTDMTDGDFFLDFLDPSYSELGKFSVSAIGRRPFVNVNNDINCLFQPEIPWLIFINNELSETDEEAFLKYISWAHLRDDPYCQVGSDIYDNLITGGYRNAAFDEIRYDFMIHTSYQMSVSMTAIPAFYMEPNTRAVVSDKTTNTYGSFLITNITIPLNAGGLMSVTGHEVFERY